ncbi:hypothetical protein WJX81_002012 [Elliptochloris bilobata]|uniref:Ubiquitin-like domain-containing protein n=1 Tax=Elliptochloris bilobata TaxID=381761 RepID=A0AAW1SD15_9CHLO
MAAEEAEQLKWVYVRVKREKATYFLHVDLQQTTFEVKAMLQDLTQRDPGDMKLWREGTELQDACKLADAQVENDEVLALAFRLKDSDRYEEVHITSHDQAAGNGA